MNDLTTICIEISLVAFIVFLIRLNIWYYIELSSEEREQDKIERRIL